MLTPLIRALSTTLEEREPKRERIPGIITAINGSVNPDHRPNWVHVRLNMFPDTTVYSAFNDATLHIEGLWVWLEAAPDEKIGLRVTGEYFGAVSPDEVVTAGRLNVPNHGANHQIPTETDVGPDPTLIFQPAIQMLKTTGDGETLIVTVQPATYSVGASTHSFPGARVNLTSHVPSVAGRVRYALLFLATGPGLITVVNGQEAPNNGVSPIELPTRPATGINSAYVRLEFGQTAVLTSSDVIDARSFFGEVGGGLPTPTRAGEILISDGLSFKVALPVVDAYGLIMTNADGTITTW